MKTNIKILIAILLIVLAYVTPNWFTITLAIISVSILVLIFGAYTAVAIIVSNPDMFHAIRNNIGTLTKCQDIDETISEIYPGFEKKKQEFIDDLKKTSNKDE